MYITKKHSPVSFCIFVMKLIVVNSAGLTAGVTAGCPAAFLLLWTLTIMVAVLCTHGSSLGQSATARLHWHTKRQKSAWLQSKKYPTDQCDHRALKTLKLTFVRCRALVSASIGAAFLLIGTVSVVIAKLGTLPKAPLSTRTHSWLIWKSDPEMSRF